MKTLILATSAAAMLATSPASAFSLGDFFSSFRSAPREPARETYRMRELPGESDAVIHAKKLDLLRARNGTPTSRPMARPVIVYRNGVAYYSSDGSRHGQARAESRSRAGSAQQRHDDRRQERKDNGD